MKSRTPYISFDAASSNLEKGEVDSDKLKDVSCPRSPSVSSDGLTRSFVFGGLDGLVTTVTASSVAFIFLPLSLRQCLITGVANCIGDAISMGLGGFISDNAERMKVVQHKKRIKEQLNNVASRIDLIEKYTENLTREEGIAKHDAISLVNIYMKYPDALDNILIDMETSECDSEDEESISSLAKSARVMFFSFVIFGFIPLIPIFIAFMYGEVAFSWTTSTVYFFIFATSLSLLFLSFFASKLIGGETLMEHVKFTLKLSGQGLLSILVALIFAIGFESFLK
jgi:vacuolar iron transporter family protein